MGHVPFQRYCSTTRDRGCGCNRLAHHFCGHSFSGAFSPQPTGTPPEPTTTRNSFSYLHQPHLFCISVSSQFHSFTFLHFCSAARAEYSLLARRSMSCDFMNVLRSHTICARVKYPYSLPISIPVVTSREDTTAPVFSSSTYHDLREPRLWVPKTILISSRHWNLLH